MSAWWLMLVLQAAAPEQSPEEWLSQRALQGETALIQAFGEIITTARSCGFPQAQIERLEQNMKAQEITRAAAANETFDATEYATAFQAGVSAVQKKLDADSSKITPEMRAEACRLARIDFDATYQIYRTDYDESPAAIPAGSGSTQTEEP